MYSENYTLTLVAHYLISPFLYQNQTHIHSKVCIYLSINDVFFILDPLGLDGWLDGDDDERSSYQSPSTSRRTPVHWDSDET